MSYDTPTVIALATLLTLAGCASAKNTDESDDQPSTTSTAQTTGDSSTAGVESARNIDIPGVDENDQSDPLADRRDDDQSSDSPDGSSPEQTASDDTTDDTVDVETRQVDIPGDPLTLKGTVHVPAPATDEPAPALVLLHGSGPLSRDEVMSGQFLTHFGFDIPVFAELADALARAGYVVLRYDKRTCHPSNNARCKGNGYPSPSADVTLHDFADDASRALDWLADRPFADGDRLVLLGHSQGGTLVPKLMHDHPEIAAGILLATPYQPIDATYRAQTDFMREMLAKSGMSDARIRAMDAYQRISQVADQLATLRDGHYDDDTLAGASTDFWRSWMDFGDAAPDLAETLDRPLLVASGRYDYNAPPPALTRWRERLAADDAPNHRVELLDCVTHALNCIDEKNPFRVKPSDLGRHVDASVTNAITDFLRSTLR